MGRLFRELSIPRLLEHLLRTNLTLLGIVLGITLLTAVALVNRSLVADFERTFEQITGKADLQVSAGSQGFSEELLEAVRATPGVFKASALMQQVVALQHGTSSSERILLLGLDLIGEDDAYFRTYHSRQLDAIKRDPLPFLNSTESVIVSRRVAERYGLKLHDRVTLMTSAGARPFEVWGFIEGEGVGRAFGGLVALMYYPAMQIAFERGRTIDRIDVALAPGADPAAVGARLRARLGDGFVVERPARNSARVASMLDGLRSGLTMAGLIALCVGMFLIHNTIAIGVAQRRRELGVLRALGMTRRQLTVLLTLEGTAFGVVGSALGVLAGAALARAVLGATAQTISERYMPLSTPELRLHTVDILSGLSLGTLSATFAAARPAWLAARAQPSAVLSSVAPAITLRAAHRWTRRDLLAALLIGCAPLLLALPATRHTPAVPFLASLLLALAGAALTPRFVQLVHRGLRMGARWLSSETRLANDNLPRELGRTSSTAAALGLGVAMATSLAVFIGSAVQSTSKWIEQSAPADLFVTSSSRFGAGTSYLPFSGALGPELAKLPGVEAAEPMRLDDVTFRGANVKLMALDMASYARHGRTELLEGDASTIVSRLQQGAVMVSENFARRFDAHVGDRIALSSSSGTRTFEVAGVAVDYTSDLGTVMLDRGCYLTNWTDSRVSAYLLYLNGSAQPERVRDAIMRVHGARYDLFVLTHREFRAELELGLGRVFGMMHALEIVALAIAALGIVNALCAGVLDRAREIGVLRALGMTRRQVRKMIVIEALLVGVSGVVAGVLIGLIEGYVLLAHVNTAQSGWRFAYDPAWSSVALMTSAVLAVCGIAGWYPARLAASTRIGEALAHH